MNEHVIVGEDLQHVNKLLPVSEKRGRIFNCVITTYLIPGYCVKEIITFVLLYSLVEGEVAHSYTHTHTKENVVVCVYICVSFCN